MMEHIHANTSGNISLADLAKIAEVTPYHLASLFTKTTGLSPHQYVLRERIERAKIYLKDERLNIAEVSRLIGFRTQEHFTKVFRRVVGMTPNNSVKSWQTRPAKTPFSLDLTKETRRNLNRERVYCEHSAAILIDNISSTNRRNIKEADVDFTLRGSRLGNGMGSPIDHRQGLTEAPRIAPVVYIVVPEEAERELLDQLVRCEGWHSITFASAEEFLTHPMETVPMLAY